MNPTHYKAHLVDFALEGGAAIERAARASGNAIITAVGEGSAGLNINSFKGAARSAGLAPAFWVEVGRDERLADAHPEWLHTPQHADWLDEFPEWEGEKAAVYPWFSVNNRAVFDYQLERISGLAEMLEPGDTVFLNNVQGPPAGCGCGNLCRNWRCVYVTSSW